MAIKPILFSTPMVKAILEGRKTQTRRILKPQPDAFVTADQGNAKLPYKLTTKKPSKNGSVWVEDDGSKYEPILMKCQPGDLLWVREGFRYVHHYGFEDKFIQYRDESTNAHCPIPDPDQIIADESGWKPSIHMPKAACRIFLEVTGVRAERLHDIDGYDIISEGVAKHLPKARTMTQASIDYFSTLPDLKIKWKELWESINGKDSWEANPWVWVYDFKQVEKPSNF